MTAIRFRVGVIREGDPARAPRKSCGRPQLRQRDEAYHYQFQAGADIAVFYGASVTGADLVMTDGKSLEKTGVTPDVIILPTARIWRTVGIQRLRSSRTRRRKDRFYAAGKMFPFEWLPLS